MIPEQTVLSQLRWRYATKKFDSQRTIPDSLWSQLEDALVLAPSSYGLQPWKFFVVRNAETRRKLQPASWGQSQIVDASHLVVFAVKAEVGPADAERLIRKTAEVRNIPAEKLAGYQSMMVGSLTRQSPDEIRRWMTHQVYIALGHFLATCAMLGVDACPMEGFQPELYDSILGLPQKGYHSVVLATVGYRAVDDPSASAPKVRFSKSELIESL